MELKILKDYNELSQAAAGLIANHISNKPDATVCFATGDTPRLCYTILTEKIKNERIDIRQCFFIGLDEWVGIAPENAGSCSHFLHHYLLDPLGMPASQWHLFNAFPENEMEECKKMDAVIAQRGGIDLLVAGIGLNGHIGFNEPGTDINTGSHIKELDEITKQTGQKYFHAAAPLQKGITVGLKQIMEAEVLLMLASGQKKATVIKKTLQNEIGTDFPATLIRQHKRGILIIDSEAAYEPEPASRGLCN